MCRERDSNPHSHYWPRDFKSLVSTNSTIAAPVSLNWSGKRDLNPRPQPWQGCALPTELLPHEALFASAKVHYFFQVEKKNKKKVLFGNRIVLKGGAAVFAAPTEKIALLA